MAANESGDTTTAGQATLMPLEYVVIFGLLLLLAHLLGSMITAWVYRGALRFQGELRQERDRLKAENNELREQLHALRYEILELRQRLGLAENYIAQQTANVSGTDG